MYLVEYKAYIFNKGILTFPKFDRHGDTPWCSLNLIRWTDATKTVINSPNVVSNIPWLFVMVRVKPQTKK